ncbi:MAG: hypothetical protein IPK76_01360 [Lewinellaceae bacterium]|nr:hypothetical protein [Lewinellaceae bacterium]
MKTDLPSAQLRAFCDWGEQFSALRANSPKAPVLYADPQIFDVFSFPLPLWRSPHRAAGNQQRGADGGVGSVVFREENPTGKTLEIKVEDNLNLSS